MSKKNNRFIKTYSQSTFSADTKIFVDTETGVNYIFIQTGYAGGLTPLLDSQGKPVVTPITLLDTEEDK